QEEIQIATNYAFRSTAKVPENIGKIYLFNNDQQAGKYWLEDIYLEAKETDKVALKIALDLANGITDEDLKDVIPVVADEFIAARDEANVVYNDTSATQEKINNAFDRLASAMHMLDFIKGDKTALKAFIDKVSGLEADKYTKDTWAAFEKELNEANAVYNDENAMQEEVNTAYSELVTAFLNLRLIPDKSLLEDLINQANGLNKANYTKATFDGLTKALNEAKAVYENPNATQEEVDNAKDVLEKAIAGLQANPSAPSNVDNTEKTSVNNGDITSVKTGDDVNMLGTLGLISSLSVIVFLKKKKISKIK
ncbi:FIVAR domain-containing protein, partial [Thomasclavelia spiroformis]|uniref:FIVAR domain-containing protein n=1 Tax=Thomasclavelia spiroformis TaxID=29348 RepID=UPI000B577EAC